LTNLTKEEAVAMLRKIMGPPRRELVGEEKSQVWLILQFLEPVEESNNQRSFTEVYHQAGRIYHVHYFPDADEPVIEELEAE
jgi:hypothetical protein